MPALCSRPGFGFLIVALFLACGDEGPTESATRIVSSVAITPSSVTLAALGETVQLTATVLDQSGHAMQGVTLVWASSDGSVATVDAGGAVTAVWNGSTTITAAAQGGGASGSAGVTVAQQPREIRVSPDQELFRALGDTLRLSARAFDANGHLVEGADYNWFSSDESVVTVDDTGLVTSAGNGSASVTASSGPASGNADFRVEQEPAEVQLSPVADTLRALGDTLRMMMAGKDANGHPLQNAGDGFAWSSADESVATVDASGLVTAVGNGSTDITATRNGLASSATVTVEQQAVEVRLPPAADTLFALGDTVRLSAEAFDANGHAMERAEFGWLSADETVVTVDGMGLVTATGNGSANVTASSGLAMASTPISIAQLATAIRVSPAADTLRWLGDTLRLSAEALDANRYSVEGTAFTWSSSDESVATVDATGLVTGEGVGTVEITAAVAGSDITDTATLQVEALPARDALVALYNATDGPNWKNNENWLTDAPVGEWFGVSTDSQGAVTGLDLTDNGLAGELPPQLGNLVDLQRLRLNYNELTGSIPTELGALSDLADLYLAGNRLTGPIPLVLAKLPSLSRLWLDYNELTGSIPPEFGNLPLRTLALHSNRLTGPIPTELTKVQGLRQLWLAENELSGPIPPGLGKLENLTDLFLRDNALVGAIPPELADLTQLKQLSLSDNQLTGPIPPGLGKLGNLETLWLGGNSLDGTIPPELGDLTQLRQLYLSRTALAGPIPPEFGNLTRLEELRLSSNRLTGPVPSEFGKLTNLRYLHLVFNPLSGPLPQELIAVPLRNFYWGGTELCAPANQAFQTWLASIPHGSRGATCSP